ncbi:MAG: hypothetical protein ACOYNZ_19380 [Rhodoferax sp.]
MLPNKIQAWAVSSPAKPIQFDCIEAHDRARLERLARWCPHRERTGIATYLLKSNPEIYPAERFRGYFGKFERGESLKWRFGGAKKMLSGDSFFLSSIESRFLARDDLAGREWALQLDLARWRDRAATPRMARTADKPHE